MTEAKTTIRGKVKLNTIYSLIHYSFYSSDMLALETQSFWRTILVMIAVEMRSWVEVSTTKGGKKL